MKRQGRVAGRWLAAAAVIVWLLQLPAAMATELLVPVQILTLGRLAERTDANGMPLPGSLQRHVSLVYPAAVAARGQDVYVADSGTLRVYRFDRSMQVFTIVPGIETVPGIRLQVAPDQSLLVLNPARSTIVRISRGGRILQTLADSVVTARWSEFAADESGARLVATDQLNGRVVSLQSLAGTVPPLLSAGESDGQLQSPGAVAFAGRAVLVADAVCHCLVELDEGGRVVHRFGGEVLRQPRAIAADRYGRVFVIDGFDRVLHVFRGGQLLESYDAARLRLVGPVALAVDGSWLYIADGPGSRIGIFRLDVPDGFRP